MDQAKWTFHDWADAIRNGKCPPNEEIFNLFRVSIEPETENGRLSWRSIKNFGSSTKQLLENYNPDSYVQSMVLGLIVAEIRGMGTNSISLVIIPGFE